MEMFDCLPCRFMKSVYKEREDGEDDFDESLWDNETAKKLSYVGKSAYKILKMIHRRKYLRCWSITDGRVVGGVDYTPKGVWDDNPAVDPLRQGHSDWLPKKMAEIMSRTKVWCDVLTLSPPDGLFMEQIQLALQTIAVNSVDSKKPVIIRIMFGNIIGMPVHCDRVIQKLTEFVPPDHNIRVWVGAWRRGASWNHSKIIAVDGKYLYTGGHNLWDPHYLKHDPVHDVSFELQGHVANDGHRFANDQWDFIRFKQDTLSGQFVNRLPDNIPLIAKTRVTISEFPTGVAQEFAPMFLRSKSLPTNCSLRVEAPIPLLTLGRYGSISMRARPSDDAFVAMMESAKKTLRLSLQDLGPICVPGTKTPLPGTEWPERYLSTIGRAIWRRGVVVQIVLSNPFSTPGGITPMDGAYGNGWSCVDVAAEIIKRIKKHSGATDSELRQKITNNLQICYIRHPKTGTTYADGMNMGLHSKHFIVDDICCYIGSQNLYVCDLAEWGVVVDDAATTQKMMQEFWAPMWAKSYKTADCDVQAVMDGLNIDREAKDVNFFMTDEQVQQMQTTCQMQNHAHNYDGLFIVDEAEAKKQAKLDLKKDIRRKSSALYKMKSSVRQKQQVKSDTDEKEGPAPMSSKEEEKEEA